MSRIRLVAKLSPNAVRTVKSWGITFLNFF